MKATRKNGRPVAALRGPRKPKRHAPRRPQARVGSIAFQRILVPVDFTAGSDLALSHAAALARLHHARVLPLHVIPPISCTVDYGYGEVQRQFPDEASLRRRQVRLRHLLHRIMPERQPDEVIVRSGEPIEQIALAAKEWRADLIIMLAHSFAGKNSTPPTHTVDGLVREVRCPVLLLHAEGPKRSRK